MKTPVPAFYCCYLLRSSVRRQAVYVGSTPNIVRRWKQHNGISTGGAVQTSRDSLRPWDVVCIVHGFPSRSAALQFEWAWQNTHLTRHIDASQRAAVKARVAVPGKIANLHLLLRSKSFERWPLSLRFFADDVYRVWKAWDDRMSDDIRSGIQAVLDPLATSGAKAAGEAVSSGLPLNVPPALAGLDMGYRAFKGHAEKAKSLLDSKARASCSVCRARLDGDHDLSLVCPHNGCTAVSHLSCLSEHFMTAKTDKNQVIPLHGRCPTCQNSTNWSTLVTELTLRTRGKPFLEKLFKAPRGKKAKLAEAAALQAGDATASQMLVEDGDDVDGGQEDEDWVFQPFEDDFDALPTLDEIAELETDDDQIPPSAQGQGSKWIEPQGRELFVDDSDWDNVEVLD